MKVAFIGTGRMGGAMTGRLLAENHDVGIYDRMPEQVKAVAAKGAKALGSIAEAARYGEAVFSMLPDDNAAIDIVEQKGGLIETLPRGGVHILGGTHSVACVQRLTAAHTGAGQVMLTTPMFGRPEMVASHSASMVVSGPAAQLKNFRPLFEAIAARVYEAGDNPVGAAAIKIANNFVLGCAIESFGEGVSLARKFGVDAQVLFDVMTEGMFNCAAYKVYGKMVVDQKYLPAGQRAILGLKDANLALTAAESVGVPLPSGNVWRDRLVGAVGRGEGEHDWGVMAREQARASGLD